MPLKDIVELLKSVFSFLKENGSGLRKFVSARPWAILVLILLLVGTIVSFCLYRNQSEKFKSFLSPGGAEAFLHSLENKEGERIIQNLTDPKSIRESIVSEELIETLNSFSTNLKTGLEKEQDWNLELLTSNRSHRFLTETDESNSEGFLYISSEILRSELYERVKKADTNSVFELEPSLLPDLAMARCVRSDLNQLLDKTLFKQDEAETAHFELKPKQVYLVTKNGLNEIHERGKDSKEVFANQFEASVFFPSRPYFWPALENSPLIDGAAFKLGIERRAEDFFHITDPYVDIGGHGLVVTLSKGIRIKGFPPAVLCMDLVLYDSQASLGQELVGAIEREGGSGFLQTWKIPQGGVPDQVEGKKASADIQNLISKRLTHNLSTLSKVLGKVSTIRDAVSDDGLVGIHPLKRTPGNNLRVDFLVFHLDVLAMKTRADWSLLATGFLTCLSIAWFGFMMWGALQELKVKNRAFAAFSEVMSKMPIPFVSLDDNDGIKSANEAFWQLVGVTADKEKEDATFEKFVHEDSVKNYENQQAKRKEKEGDDAQLENYDLYIKNKKGNAVSRQIVSAISSKNKSGELPATFGILLTKTEYERAKALEPKNNE